ncbi:MAG: type IV secretory system conjugative DNA transfer family protein [Pirellulales bacterium]
MSPQWWRRAVASIISWPARRPSDEVRHDPLTVSASRLHDREEDLQAAADKLGRHLFEARLTVSISFPTAREKEAARRLPELVGSLGHFNSPRTACFVAGRPTKHKRLGPLFLLSTEELATLFHPPTQTVQGSSVARVETRELEPPKALRRRGTTPDSVQLGRAQYRDERHDVTLAIDDRRRHLAIFGKTGTGKSTLLQNLIVADIRAGRGVALVDPHGDLAASLVELIPRNRTNDIVLFDLADTEYPLSFNPLDCTNPALRPLVASAVLSAFKKLYASMWGPRLEHILRNALLALLEVRGASLVQVLPLLTDERYRNSVVRQIRDPAVKRFWEQEFAAMPARLRGEAISPVLNKIGHFVSSPLLRHVVGQSRSTLDLRQVMDDGRILIVNLAKGRIGEDASALLGALVVTALQLAAISRADVLEADRPDFFAYIDEFSNFATGSFATIFSEARKYRLALTVATQFIEQLDELTQAAVFGNVGTTVVFQSSQRDAEVLAAHLGGDLQPPDLLTLPKYQAFTKLLIEGVPTLPFSMRTLPPLARGGDEQAPEIIRRTSRHRYARPLKRVERELAGALA